MSGHPLAQFHYLRGSCPHDGRVRCRAHGYHEIRPCVGAHFLARRPVLAEHAFVISSFGKTYLSTGWKIGYC